MTPIAGTNPTPFADLIDALKGLSLESERNRTELARATAASRALRDSITNPPQQQAGGPPPVPRNTPVGGEAAALTQAIRGLALESERHRTELAGATAASKALRDALVSPPQQPQDAAGSASGVSQAAKGAAMATAAVAAVTGILNKGTQLGNIANNSSLTNAQKSEEFGKALPVVGGLIGAMLSLREAMRGTEDRVRQAGRAYERQVAAFERYSELAALSQRADIEENVAESKSRSVGRTPLAGETVGAGDRMSLEGSQRHAIEQRMLPHKDAVREAGDSAWGAREALADAERRNAQHREMTDAARGRMRDAQEKMRAKLDDEKVGGKGTDKAGKVEAARELQTTSKEAAIEAGLLAKSAEEVQARRLDLAQRDNDLAKAKVASLREELNLITAQGERLRSNSARLGGMTQGQRQQGLQALRHIKEHGLGRSTPNILAAARGFAPDYVRKKEEEFGETTPESKAAKREGFFGIDTGSIMENSRAEERARTDVRVQVVLDEDALAGKIVEALKQGFGDVIAAVKLKQEAQESERKGGVQLGNAIGNR